MAQPDEAAHTRCVAWQITQTWQAAEWCRLVETRAGIDLSGAVAGAIDGTPFRVDYAIVCGADWLTRSARVTHWLGAAPPRQLEIECEAGRWTVGGADAPAPHLGIGEQILQVAIVRLRPAGAMIEIVDQTHRPAVDQGNEALGLELALREEPFPGRRIDLFRSACLVEGEIRRP